MIIDDEIGALTLIGIMLERSGFSVMKAKDPRVALTMLDSQTPDMIILDVMMPYMNGIELCQILRQRADTATLPIIILSARGDSESVMRAMEAGVNDYLPKPILHHDLVAKVRSMLGENGGGVPIDGSPRQQEAMGELFERDPSDALTSLPKEAENEWAGRITAGLTGVDVQAAGRSVIAAALWHHARFQNAPFNGTAGQRAFWSHVRHSLGSYTASGAIERWAGLAPVAAALMKPANELVNALGPCMDEDNADCRQWALRILVENGDPHALALAEEALADPDADVRTMGIVVLEKLGGMRHVPALAQLLNDSQPGVREQAAEALAKIDGDLGEFALTAAIKQGSPKAAEAAANGLALLGSDPAIKALIDAADSRTEEQVLTHVLHALGKVNTPACKAVLVRFAALPDPALSRVAKLYADK